MFEKEWFPYAYLFGITWNEFWNMNPRIIMAIAEGYKKKVEEQMQIENTICHLQGKYFADALICTVGKWTKHKYPEKPYEAKKSKELTQEEIETKRKEFVAKMQAMKANFDANKKEVQEK